MIKKQLRLLMIVDRFNIGGTETYVLSVLKELKKRGIPVFAAGLEGPLLKTFRKLQIPVFTAIRDHQKLKNWVKSNRINVVNSHMANSGIRAAKVCRELNIPLFITIHGTYYKMWKIRDLSRIKRPRFISVSEPTKRWLYRGLGFHSLVIPNGIDTSQFYPRNPTIIKRKLRIPPSAAVLVYSSRLEGEKANIGKSIIRAFERHLYKAIPHLHLLIVGSGKDASSLKNMVALRYRKNIHFLGQRIDMPNIYSASNCVIGTGRVALEAMSTQRPIVAVGSAGMVGIVESSNLKKAWRQNFGDHHAEMRYSDTKIAAVAKRILGSVNMQRSLGKLGRSFILKNCNISHVANQLIKQYTSDKRGP